MNEMGFLEKLLGDPNKKEVKKVEKIVDQIEALDEQMQALSDEDLKNKTAEFKKRLSDGETLDDIMVEAFAVAREGAVRTLGLKAYRVQLIGGIVLHQGRITEMKTGEGKTLTATLPLYLNALDGKGAHLITVNDYLAKRDKEWMSKLYNFLGLEVGCIINGVKGQDRVDAYRADITYGTNNEFGFDYLRDNMVVDQKAMVQRKPHFAIVDEVDSILIDEARTPLIISGQGAKSTDLYGIANTFVRTLKKEDDFTIEEKEKSAVLTDEGGVVRAEKFFGIENLSDPEHMEISHHINNALKANTLMKKDVDYVVKDGEILIVDEFTGRLMFGRRYSNGLHQAIEAKEGLEVRKESQTLATITLQNYFRMYEKLAGMTGTAKTEEDEFRHIYNMDVVVVPTNRPIARQDLPDSIYKSMEGKYRAVLKDIVERHQTGQPILVGTIAIETSEFISQILKRQGIKHEVLNAKQHEREAEIVAQAGRLGAVTIATNMAGRGTDIVLGGNPDFMAKHELTKKGYTEEQIYTVVSPLESDDPEILEGRKLYDKHFADYKIVADAEAAKVKEAGGLHIIGTERHESRRIDNQLRGRSGRQGDPGSSQFYISFDDDLMRLFSSDRVKDMVEKLGMEDDMPLEANILTKSIEGAQKKVEGRNFGIRKHVLQYDDVMNRQREIIYTERGKVLHGDNVKEDVENMLEKLIEVSIANHTSNSEYGEEWDLKGLIDHLHQIYLPKDAYHCDDVESLTREQLKADLLKIGRDLYAQKEEEFTPERFREVERYILLKVVDSKWIDHIDAMDQLKQGIGLRAVGQEDPVRAYQNEGFDMFGEMIDSIQEDTVRYLFGATLQTNTERRQQAVITGSSSASTESAPKKPELRKEPKVGRNDPCPCGSGKKYKKCHGAND